MTEENRVIEEMRTILARAHPLSDERKMGVILQTMGIPGMEPIIRHFVQKYYPTSKIHELSGAQLTHVFEYCQTCSLMLKDKDGGQG